MDESIAVKITNLTKSFAGTKAIDAISTLIKAGELTALVGPDGAGKTTLIRMLANLMAPTAGSIKFNLKPSNTNAMVGYMPQCFGLYDDLTVMENLRLYAALQKISSARQEKLFNQLLEFTNLSSFTNRLAGNLSGGMKQKLALACALMARPKLLLLDEPSVGVDPISRKELWDMVKSLTAGGMSVIWASTYMDEAQRAQSVLLLDKGKLLYQGSPKALMDRYKVDNFAAAFIELLGGFKMQRSIIAEKMPVKPVTNKAMVQCSNLTKKFKNFIACNNISFAVKQGEIFALLGPNGAGKSTTFKMLCGLIPASSGSAKVAGLEFKLAGRQAKLQLGYMAQKFSLYNLLSVRQNLNFFAGVYNLKGIDKKTRINEMIETFALEQYLDTEPALLPLGFKQRLALACALMHRPAVLFLDEPTSGVDPITRAEFWTHIKALAAKGMTIMVTTHFMDEAEYCDRIALMDKGELIALDAPANLKKRVSPKNFNITMEQVFIDLVNKRDNNMWGSNG